MNKKFGIKEVVAMGIGTALFVVLTEVQIPIGIPNTSLQPRMAVLAFLSAIFGPLVGAVIGLLGHALGDALFYGSVWWSWVFPEAVVGIAIGAFAKKFAVREGGFDKKNIVLFNVVSSAISLLSAYLDHSFLPRIQRWRARAHLFPKRTDTSLRERRRLLERLRAPSKRTAASARRAELLDFWIHLS